ncbi:MAG: DNA polymerase III subunit gamma/tau [Pseudomonadota bacterium]
MSYLVLARKWRPKTFSELVGQEHVVRALTNALETGRLHHAYLFSGTRGVGKTTIARILAKALNCVHGPTAEPCGVCPACVAIDEGRFVDLIEVDAASKTKVDDTRELLDNVQFAPSGGRFKVYLIDEVHMLTKHSFNALLKTLEEPPPHVKFLLATTDPQKLPVTVLSRCLQFNLKRMTPGLIRGRLEYICGEEGVASDTEALTQIARAADGSLRDALSILDQAIAYCGGEVREQGVVDMLGTIDRKHVSRLLGMLESDDAPGLMGVVAEIDEQFPDYGHMLDDLAAALQQVAVQQIVGETEAESLLSAEDMARFAEQIPAEDLQLYYQIAITGRRDLSLAPTPRSGVEMTLLRMLAFKPDDGQRATSSGKTRQRAASRPQPAAPQAQKGASSAAGRNDPPKIVSAELSSRPSEPSSAQPPGASSSPNPGSSAPAAWSDALEWANLVEALGLRGGNQLLASNCALLGREDNVIRLGLDRGAESWLNKSREQALAEALSSHFGESLRVEVVVGSTPKETPIQQQAREEDEDLQAKRDDLESDPNIIALKDMFGATIDPDSVKVIQKQ